MFSSPPPDPYLQAIAWADRMYERANIDTSVEFTLDAYRAIEKRYGARAAVRIGEGRCLVILGKYADAANAFSTASPRERQQAVRAAVALVALRRQVPKDVDVYQILEVNGVGWVGLCGRELKKAPYKLRGYSDPDGFYQFELRTLGSPAVLAPQMWMGDGKWGRLISMPLAHDKSCLVMITGFEGNTAPGQADVYEVSGKSLSLSHHFEGDYGVTAERAPDGRLLVCPTVTFKVEWTDVYEWRNGRFVFASSRYRSKFETDLQALKVSTWKYDRDRYVEWCRYASTCGIAGDWKRARWGWQRAERCCRGSVREDAVGVRVGSGRRRYLDLGFAGDSKENLKEIRQRLRWIARKEYNHPLLYRPLDFDYQVSPYRLGKAELPDR